MTDVRCSHCGKDNPDFFDVCQFCQSPLKPESMVHTGEEPTQKDTGELEEILPDWLKDARQQGKDEGAVDDAFQSQTKPKVPKEEPPDLLAGLMSQADSDDDEVPDWLAEINPVIEKDTSATSAGDEQEPSDFFAQFRQADAQSSTPAVNEPAQDEMPASMGMEKEPSEQKDELTDWFSKAASEPSAPSAFDETGGIAPDDNSWMGDFGSFTAAEQEPPVEKEPEDLGWLHDLEAASKGTGELPTPKKDAGFDFPSSSDEDLNWLDNLGGTPVSSSEEPVPSQPASSNEDLSWLDNLGGTITPAEEPVPTQPPASDEHLSWLNNLGGTLAPSEEPAPSQPASSDGGDLNWLDNLGGTGTSAEEPVPTQPPASEEDLSWLNNLGGTSAPSAAEESPTQPPPFGKDLNWLNNLGSTPVPSSEEPVTSSESTSPEGDLDWLKDFGEAPAPAFEEPVTPQSTSSDDDLDWLNKLGAASTMEEPVSTQPASSQDDLDWLNNLAGTSEPSAPAFADTGQLSSGRGTSDSSKPFQTAPLNELLGDESVKDTTPDWLKSAMEEPAMPAPGAVSMDWFSEHEKTAEGEPAEGQVEESDVPTQEESATSQPAFDFSFEDSSATSARDVDSLFMEMPDWLSREPERTDESQVEGTPEPAPEGEALSPVELPSWVQAMRPVDSAISSDTAADTMDQVTESEGPLAGFRGVIPFAPIGSSLRPKAFSVKLQITEEQQASASLLEQIIASETTIQPRKVTEGISSQKVWRWILSALFILVLGTVLGLGSRTIPVSGSDQLSKLVGTIPDSEAVLVVIDYEPSFTGELEAAAGPLLDQLALSRRSTFSFVSMSPNGTALVDRLMFNTGIRGTDVLNYQPGEKYFNLGFLPGGSAGVLGFIENSKNEFSKFEAVILMTDNSETGRVWVEQLDFAKGKYQSLVDKPFIVISSAQSAPLLQPYVSSGQVDLMVNGLYDAAKYEYVNNTRPGIARSYWDAFGIGLTMAIIAIILGSLWNVLMQIRERRAEAE